VFYQSCKLLLETTFRKSKYGCDSLGMFGTAKAFNLRPHGELRLLYEKSFDIIKKRLTQNKINESNQSTLV
jgi:hypothetical protein